MTRQSLQNRLARIETALGKDGGGAVASLGGKIGEHTRELARKFYELGITRELNMQVATGTVLPHTLAPAALIPEPMLADTDSAILLQITALRETLQQRRNQAVSV